MQPLLDNARAQTLPTVLLLAAGRGERFSASGGSGSKLQADLAGKTVLQRTLDAVQASGLHWHLEQGPHPGMGDAIAAAVRATRSAAGWMILPADLPLIAPLTLAQLALADPAAEVLLPVYAGQGGHPVRFARKCGEALTALQGPAGAAGLLARFHTVVWPVGDAGCVIDIDTLADLERVRIHIERQSVHAILDLSRASK